MHPNANTRERVLMSSAGSSFVPVSPSSRASRAPLDTAPPRGHLTALPAVTTAARRLRRAFALGGERAIEPGGGGTLRGAATRTPARAGRHHPAVAAR